MNRSSRVKKFATLLMLMMRLSSLGCFAYSGYVGIKAYGPDGFKIALARLKAMVNQEENDPLALAMKEREARKAAESQRSKNANGEEMSTGSSDNPYDYVQGGKAAAKKKKTDEDEESSQEGDVENPDSVANADGAKSSLWDKGKMGDGGFGGISGFGGGGGSGGGGSSGGGGASAANQLKSAASSMGTAASNASAASGKSARSAKAGTSRGAFGSRATGSSKSRLKGAVGTAAKGGKGGFQTGAGYTGASFGEGSTGKTLDIADATGDLAAGSGLSESVDNPLDESQYEADIEDLEEEEGTSEKYEDMQRFFAIASIAITVFGIALVAMKLVKDFPITKGAWTALWAVGLAAIIALGVWCASLAASDDAMEKALGVGFLGSMIPMVLGWVAMIASEVTAMMMIGQIGTVATTALGLANDSSSSSDTTSTS